MSTATETDTKQVTDVETKLPKMYKVLLHNDDHHSFDEVIRAVQTVFKYEIQKVFEIVYEAHEKGLAICKIEPLETAELHRDQLQSFGLTATIEPD